MYTIACTYDQHANYALLCRDLANYWAQRATCARLAHDPCEARLRQTANRMRDRSRAAARMARQARQAAA